MFSTLATVLRIRNIRERDRLITLYTKDLGKIQVMGRGMNTMRSKLAGHVREFTVASVTIVRGVRFDTMTAISVERQYPSITQSLDRYAVGAYILELMDKWTREEVCDELVWSLVTDSLQALESGADPLAIRWSFPLKFTQRLGLKIRFDACLGCDKTFDPSASVVVDSIHGGAWCVQCPAPEGGMRLESAGWNAIAQLERETYENVPAMSWQLPATQHAIRLLSQQQGIGPLSSEQWGRWAIQQSSN